MDRKCVCHDWWRLTPIQPRRRLLLQRSVRIQNWLLFVGSRRRRRTNGDCSPAITASKMQWTQHRIQISDDCSVRRSFAHVRYIFLPRLAPAGRFRSIPPARHVISYFLQGGAVRREGFIGPSGKAFDCCKWPKQPVYSTGPVRPAKSQLSSPPALL